MFLAHYVVAGVLRKVYIDIMVLLDVIEIFVGTRFIINSILFIHEVPLFSKRMIYCIIQVCKV